MTSTSTTTTTTTTSTTTTSTTTTTTEFVLWTNLCLSPRVIIQSASDLAALANCSDLQGSLIIEKGDFSLAPTLSKLQTVQGSLVIRNTTGFSWNLLPALRAVGTEVAALRRDSIAMGVSFLSLDISGNAGLSTGSQWTWRKVLELSGSGGGYARLNDVCLADQDLGGGVWWLKPNWLVAFALSSQCPSCLLVMNGLQCVSPYIIATNTSEVCRGGQVKYLSDLDYYKQHTCTTLTGSLQLTGLAGDITEHDLSLAFGQVQQVLGGGITVQDCQQVVVLDFLASLRSALFLTITDNNALVDARVPNLDNATAVTVARNQLLCASGMPRGTAPCNKVQTSFEAAVLLPASSQLNISTINVTELAQTLLEILAAEINSTVDANAYELTDITQFLQALNLSDSTSNDGSGLLSSGSRRRRGGGGGGEGGGGGLLPADQSADYNVRFHITLTIACSAKVAAAITDALLKILQGKSLIDQLKRKFTGFEQASELTTVAYVREAVINDYHAGVLIKIKERPDGVLIRWSLPPPSVSKFIAGFSVQYRPVVANVSLERLGAYARENLVRPASTTNPSNTTASRTSPQQLLSMASAMVDAITRWTSVWVDADGAGNDFTNTTSADTNASSNNNSSSSSSSNSSSMINNSTSYVNLFIPSCHLPSSPQQYCFEQQMPYEVRIVSHLGSSSTPNVSIMYNDINNNNDNNNSDNNNGSESTSSADQIISPVYRTRLQQDDSVSQLQVESRNSTAVRVQWTVANSSSAATGLGLIRGYAMSVFHVNRAAITSSDMLTGQLPEILDRLQQEKITQRLYPLPNNVTGFGDYNVTFSNNGNNNNDSDNDNNNNNNSRITR